VLSRNPVGPLRTHKISIKYCPLNKHRKHRSGCSVIILSDKYHLSIPAGIPFVASRRRCGSVASFNVRFLITCLVWKWFGRKRPAPMLRYKPRICSDSRTWSTRVSIITHRNDVWDRLPKRQEYQPLDQDIRLEINVQVECLPTYREKPCSLRSAIMKLFCMTNQ